MKKIFVVLMMLASVAFAQSYEMQLGQVDVNQSEVHASGINGVTVTIAANVANVNEIYMVAKKAKKQNGFHLINTSYEVKTTYKQESPFNVSLTLVLNTKKAQTPVDLHSFFDSKLAKNKKCMYTITIIKNDEMYSKTIDYKAVAQILNLLNI